MSGVRASAFIAIAVACAATFGGCAAQSHCPKSPAVGVPKPPPVNPITTPYASNVDSAFEILDFSLFDSSRNRKIPIRVYLPTTGERLPVILFSHGLGSSRAGYAYLGRSWASHDYIAIHVEHVDSDAGLSLYRLYKASYAPQVWKDRPRDITFALDALERKDPALEQVWKRTDLTRVGVAGHSYGAQTALNVAGLLMNFRGGENDVSFADPRIDAVVALSVPFMPASPDPASFRPVHVPVLHMSGTLDESPAFDTLLCHKRVPFDWIPASPQYLVIMDGAVHRSFAGEKEAGGKDIELFHRIIVEFTTAFWDAMLRNDPRARDWLDRAVQPRVTIERK